MKILRILLFIVVICIIIYRAQTPVGEWLSSSVITFIVIAIIVGIISLLYESRK